MRNDRSFPALIRRSFRLFSSIIHPFERIARREEIVAVAVVVEIRSVADRFLGITFFVLDELCATFYLSRLSLNTVQTPDLVFFLDFSPFSFFFSLTLSLLEKNSIVTSSVFVPLSFSLYPPFEFLSKSRSLVRIGRLVMRYES